MGIKRKATAILLCIIMAFGVSAACMLPESALAAASAADMTTQSAEILIDHVAYSASKKTVTVYFVDAVSWKSQSVSAKVVPYHSTKNYSNGILRKTSAKIIIKVDRLTKNRNYQFTVSGVKVKGTAGKYTVSKGVFSAK
ncbi:MAG: hypothetical protein LKJ83_00330 [Eubacteriaceae bacterium]|jgi:hypothetical protein|nr:hypothetical protein [Eubacteriaceae bacterium]